MKYAQPVVAACLASQSLASLPRPLPSSFPLSLLATSHSLLLTSRRCGTASLLLLFPFLLSFEAHQNAHSQHHTDTTDIP